jgi:hypothetical protein
MLIEYQIEVRNGTAVVTQRIELGNAAFVAAQKPSGEEKPGTETKDGKVSILDLPPSFEVQQSSASAKPKSGGGDHDPAGTGGGGPGSGLVIVFGPVVVMPSGGTGSGGGDHDPAGTGGTPDQKSDAV